MDSRYQTQINLLALTLVSLILGLMIMVAVNTQILGRSMQEKNTQDLVGYVETLQQDVASLETAIKTTREQIDAIQSGQAESELLTSSLTATYNRLSKAVGLSDLVGPGILITLDDNIVGAELAQKNNPATYNPESYLIHDKDLLYLTRAICGEAEAISVNQIRLTDNSSIRCVGTVILVNGTRLAPPYEIRAIGDGQRLAALAMESRRYKLLVYDNKPIKIAYMDNLHIPASGSMPATTYSMPQPAEAAED